LRTVLLSTSTCLSWAQLSWAERHDQSKQPLDIFIFLPSTTLILRIFWCHFQGIHSNHGENERLLLRKSSKHVIPIQRVVWLIRDHETFTQTIVQIRPKGHQAQSNNSAHFCMTKRM
jgi:hypothetical protein